MIDVHTQVSGQHDVMLVQNARSFLMPVIWGLKKSDHAISGADRPDATIKSTPPSPASTSPGARPRIITMRTLGRDGATGGSARAQILTALSFQFLIAATGSDSALGA